MRQSPPTREELLAAAREDTAAGMPGLARLLADEAEHAPNSRADNARIARDFPGGQRRKD